MTRSAAALLLLLAAPAAAAPITMAEAVRSAVERNVSVKVARAADEEAKARELAAAAGLLPQVVGTMSQQRIFRENLASQGFASIGLPVPLLLGPFDSFDARFRLAMNVLDAPSWKRWSAARELGRAAAVEQDLASEQVAGAAALAYIEALRARETIRAAQAGVDLARELVELSRQRRAAGTAMGLDLARAQSREADERLRLLDARTAVAEADLRLKRLLGLPLSQPLEPSETMVLRGTDTIRGDAEIAAALSGRLELSVAKSRLAAAGLDLSASRWERLPRVSVNGDIGLSGEKPNSGARTTGSIGAALSIPIFDWRLTSRVKESRAARDETQARFDDLAIAVEEDARRALDRLGESAERVQASQLSAQLSHRELELARGRFEAGVGDNLELVDAQTAVARAEDRLAAALASFETARVNLALATGRMRSFAF